MEQHSTFFVTSLYYAPPPIFTAPRDWRIDSSPPLICTRAKLARARPADWWRRGRGGRTGAKFVFPPLGLGRTLAAKGASAMVKSRFRPPLTATYLWALARRVAALGLARRFFDFVVLMIVRLHGCAAVVATHERIRRIQDETHVFPPRVIELFHVTSTGVCV